MSDETYNLIKTQFDKINRDHEERCKKIDRFDLFMKWSFGILVAAMALEPFIIIFARGLCN